MSTSTPKSYKSSSVLRSICCFAIGFQIAMFAHFRSWSFEDIILLVLYALGLFVSKTKKPSHLKVFAVLILLFGVVRAFVRINGFSDSKGISINFIDIKNIRLSNWIQFLISVVLALLAFILSK
jgi:hypothetical protein